MLTYPNSIGFAQGLGAGLGSSPSYDMAVMAAQDEARMRELELQYRNLYSKEHSKPTIHSRLTLCRKREAIERDKQRIFEEQRKWLCENWMPKDEEKTVEQICRTIENEINETSYRLAKMREPERWWEFWK